MPADKGMLVPGHLGAAVLVPAGPELLHQL